MVYEGRDEMDLAEEDRLYEQDPYQVNEFSDTFREQLGESATDDDLMSEDEAAADAAAPVTESETVDMEADEFGETVTPDEPTTEDELDKEPDFHPSPDDLEED